MRKSTGADLWYKGFMNNQKKPTLDEATIKQMTRTFFAKAKVKVYRSGSGYAYIPGETPEAVILELEERFRDDK